MHITTKIDIFKQRLKAAIDVLKFTVGGREFQTLITRPARKFC